MNIMAIGAVVIAVLVALLGVQTFRLDSAQVELGGERAAKAIAVARVEGLARERTALQSALVEREAAHEQIARLRVTQTQQLKELERNDPTTTEVLDLALPVSVAGFVRDRRRAAGSSTTATAGEPAARLPAPQYRTVDRAGSGGDDS